jgi:predicted TIM-barrel fold metal-dependent hydrolase
MHLVTAELLQMYPDHVVSWVRVNPTTDEKTQTSKTSKKIREKRFDDVATKVLEILETKNATLVYIPDM